MIDDENGKVWGNDMSRYHKITRKLAVTNCIANDCTLNQLLQLSNIKSKSSFVEVVLNLFFRAHVFDDER